MADKAAQQTAHTPTGREACGRIDAHIHPDTICYGNVLGRTVFYLEHHPNLIEYEAAQLRKLWEAAPQMLEALEAAKLLFAKDHALDRFDWGKSFLRAEDIQELNELPFKIEAALKAAKEGA